jgi:hypothetical protein
MNKKYIEIEDITNIDIWILWFFFLKKSSIVFSFRIIYK